MADVEGAVMERWNIKNNNIIITMQYYLQCSYYLCAYNFTIATADHNTFMTDAPDMIITQA